MKLNDLHKYFLIEGEKKDRKIFYSLDINVAGEGSERFKAKGDGLSIVPASSVSTIMSVEDVITYLVSNEVKKFVAKEGAFSNKDVLKEMLMAFVDDDNSAKEYATRTDKVLFTFDYGNAIDDSVGLVINKMENSSDFSVVVRKDGDVQNTAFDKNLINSQIQFFSKESY